jgi:hypothetical protein
MDEEERQVLIFAAKTPGFWVDDRAKTQRSRVDRLVALGFLTIDANSPYSSPGKPFYGITDSGRAALQEANAAKGLTTDSGTRSAGRRLLRA